MRGLPVEIQEEIAKQYSYLIDGIEFDFPNGSKYFLNFDMDLIYNGIKWEARSFKYDNAIMTIKSEVDYVTFKIDNRDGFFTNLTKDYDVRKSLVTIYRFALQDPAKIVAHTMIFRGLLDNITITEEEASIRIANPFILWKIKTPRRIHQATCMWEFKGTECAYTGAETECDQTFERCKQLGNECNFGGFRFLPSLQDKEIRWGRK